MDALYAYADAMGAVEAAAETLAEALSLGPASPCADGMPRGGGAGRPTEVLALRTDALQEALRTAWADSDTARAAVEAMIAGAPVGPAHRDVLRARYLRLDPRGHGRRAVRPLRAVAAALGLSESYVRALHAEALRALGMARG